VLQQRRGNGAEALELRWSGSERNKSALIHCLCAVCYTKELTGVSCAEAEEGKKKDKPLICCSFGGGAALECLRHGGDDIVC
jgi:hypothetical protein